jgi:DNA-directed RNA polymerase subunit M/transcription elongation factor TFIIS
MTSLSCPPNEFRASIRRHLAKVVDVDVVKLEKGVFNKTIQECSERHIIKKWENPKFLDLYLAILKTVHFNLQKDPSIINAANPQKVAFMTHQEMAPEQWRPIMEKKEKTDQYEKCAAITTDQFVCGKCKQRKCAYTQAQTRSADEPMTTFVTCLNCGHRWRC